MGLVGKCKWTLKNVKTGKERSGIKHNTITPLGRSMTLMTGCIPLLTQIGYIKGESMALNNDTGSGGIGSSTNMIKQVLFSGLQNTEGLSHIPAGGSNVLAWAKTHQNEDVRQADEGFVDLPQVFTGTGKIVSTAERIQRTFQYDTGIGTGNISHVAMLLDGGMNVFSYIGKTTSQSSKPSGYSLPFIPGGWCGVPEGSIALDLQVTSGGQTTSVWKKINLSDFTIEDFEPYGTYSGSLKSPVNFNFVRFSNYLINLFASTVMVYNIDTDTVFEITNSAYTSYGTIVTIESTGGVDKLYVSYAQNSSTTSVSNWKTYIVEIGTNNVSFTQQQNVTDHIASDYITNGFKYGAYIKQNTTYKFILSKQLGFYDQLYMVDSLINYEANSECCYYSYYNSYGYYYDRLMIYDNYIITGVTSGSIIDFAICDGSNFGNLYSIFELNETKEADEILTLTYFYQTISEEEEVET